MTNLRSLGWNSRESEVFSKALILSALKKGLIQGCINPFFNSLFCNELLKTSLAAALGCGASGLRRFQLILEVDGDSY